MRPSVTRKNLINTVKVEVKLKGQRSILAKTMFVRAQTSLWIDGLKKNFTQLLKLLGRSVARKNHIRQTQGQTSNIFQNYVCPGNTNVETTMWARQCCLSAIYKINFINNVKYWNLQLK